MANVFVSHRKLDNVAAERLARDVEQRGHNVWFDEWRIDVGDSIVARIEEGLQEANYLVLCYSGAGLSDWVNLEWMSTLARQMGGRGVKVLPVLLTGGRPPAILEDIKFADLVADWDEGLRELLKAIR